MSRRLQSQTRAAICDCGLYAATARNSPLLVLTSTVSPTSGLPVTLEIAPENTHGWRRLSDFSRPALSTSLFMSLTAKTIMFCAGLGDGPRRMLLRDTENPGAYKSG